MIMEPSVKLVVGGVGIPKSYEKSRDHGYSKDFLRAATCTAEIVEPLSPNIV